MSEAIYLLYLLGKGGKGISCDFIEVYIFLQLCSGKKLLFIFNVRSGTTCRYNRGKLFFEIPIGTELRKIAARNVAGREREDGEVVGAATGI
uniref:Unkown protein n=1 Tax=Riptortus pedestris TaxID=329032 RepID=R4WKN7_RIPPE|nr:unkown protein [Riptortus pedestris]